MVHRSLGPFTLTYVPRGQYCDGSHATHRAPISAITGCLIRSVLSPWYAAAEQRYPAGHWKDAAPEVALQGQPAGMRRHVTGC